MSSEAEAVTYKNATKNQLRHALWSAWNLCCYVCRKPTGFLETEIDHIIPKSLKQPERSSTLARFGLSADFDLDNVGNLAPICKPCNGPGMKGSSNLKTLAVQYQLERAMQRKSAVIEAYTSFKSNASLAKHLIAITSANVSDPVVRDLLRQHVPAVVGQLARVEPVELVMKDLDVVRLIESTGLEIPVTINIGARARRTITALEEVYGVTFESLIEEPLIGFVDDRRREVCDMCESVDDTTGPFSASPAVALFEAVTISAVTRNDYDSTTEFEIEGEFEGNYSVTVTRTAPDGDGLDDLEAEPYLTGAFSFILTGSVLGGSIDSEPDIHFEVEDSDHGIAGADLDEGPPWDGFNDFD